MAGWSDERVELAKTMWKDGKSASEIATTLRNVSRNAVIGKLHRLGLSARSMGTTRKRSARSYSSPFNRPRKVRFRFGAPENDTPIPAMSLPPPQQTDVARISFLDIDEKEITIPLANGETRKVIKHCKFRIPNTPPDSRALEYCGDERVDGLPYCETHAKRAYGAPPPRQYKVVKPGGMLIRVAGGMKFEDVS